MASLRKALRQPARSNRLREWRLSPTVHISITDMTNYKQLCAELLEWAERTSSHYYKQADVIIRARAALAKPEPEDPTDEELLRVAAISIEPYESSGISIGEYEAETECAIEVYGSELIGFARAVLARWGNHPGSPDSSSHPVTVSERLPGPDDCDEQGHVWAWRVYRPQDDDNGDFWMQIPAKWLSHIPFSSSWSHWLPAHALPQPSSPSH